MEYINKAKILADHLATNSEPISDGDLIMYVLGGLCPNYIPFLTSMNMPKIKPTLIDFHINLKAYDRMIMRQSHQVIDSSFQAHLTSNKSQSSQSNSQFFGKPFNLNNLGKSSRSSPCFFYSVCSIKNYW